MLSWVRIHTSTMSEFDKAMQPSVQSLRGVIGGGVFEGIGQAVDHDGAARCPSVLARTQLVGLVRIGHLNREKVLAPRVAPRKIIASLRRAEVVLALFLSHRAQAERDLVRAEQVVAAVEVQFALGLVHHDVVGCGDVLSQTREGMRRADREHQERP